LIPNLSDVSIGVGPGTTGINLERAQQHTFHFDTEKEPHYKYVRRIDNEDAHISYSKMIYEMEAQVSKKKGLPLIDRKVLSEMISEASSQERLLIFNPVVANYAFAFPFGNYSVCPAMRVVGEDLELMFPIRSYVPEMVGYLATSTDKTAVEKEARHICDMLKADQRLGRNDATLLVCCINRRLQELMAGIRSGTEAEILKEELSSTQVIGFLATGELSFTHLMQEPYFHAFTCWGITLHSETEMAKPKEKRKELGIKGWMKGPTDK